MEDDIETRRPGGVTVAAVLLVVAGMVNGVLTLFLQQPPLVKGTFFVLRRFRGQV